MGKSKISKEEEEAYERQEDFIEGQDQQLVLDQQQQKNFQYASNATPEDLFQYKKFTHIPEAQAEFPGIIDKDLVFANLKEAQRVELRFLSETIVLCQDIFVKEQDVKTVDNRGREVLIKDVPMFDEDFRPVVNYLKDGYKFDIVGSRSDGDTRAAMLDISNFNNINKQITKKKADDNSSRWGFGKS